ncbi:fimbrial biogenesis chaperone [Pseudomonas pergaminensis]
MVGMCKALGAGALLVAVALSAHAEIVIDRTRVIYSTEAKEVTFKLQNEADGPRLVQMWIDQGDVQQSPEVTDVPFTFNPPIARIEAGKSMAPRLFLDAAGREQLPNDRESLYWLNVLSIAPSAEKQEEGGNIQFAFRTRIKLFLRPPSLPVPVNQAPGKLQWRHAGQGVVHVSNPGPYHVTLSSISWHDRTGVFSTDDPPMLAPFESAQVALSREGQAPSRPPLLSFTTLDDLGHTQTHQASVAAND